MKILVVGGTGMIGGHIASHLAEQGNQVTIGARKPPQPGTAMAQMPVILGDYIAGDYSKADLAPFDAIVFAAGNDVRHIPEGGDDGYWQRANTEAIPRFFALARDAGVKKMVNVGSFYPHVAPELIETNAYVRSRHESCQAVRALATPGFSVVSVNAPFVVGTVPGLSVPMFEAYTHYAEGKFAPLPAFGPAGGTNFISTLSLAEAVWGALQHGTPGKAYLVGDENLSFADYFQHFFNAAGSNAQVESLDQEHPMLPDAAIFTGRGNQVSYEPDAAETALLDYRRGDVGRAIADIVAQYRTI
ncbi:MAG: NAD-dependent epimerase/dehydratase family protein [Sphingomonadaceae bacterium]